jgi:hypothetical protein
VALYTIPFVATEDDDLPHIRHELRRLVWSRNEWSTGDALQYQLLAAREAQLLGEVRHVDHGVR